MLHTQRTTVRNPWGGSDAVPFFCQYKSGDFVHVKIVRATPTTLYGELVPAPADA